MAQSFEGSLPMYGAMAIHSVAELIYREVFYQILTLFEPIYSACINACDGTTGVQSALLDISNHFHIS